MKKPLIIIPAFNEEQNIERVVDNLIENYSQYDYVIINDGSFDNTRKICKRRGYNILDLPVNLGLSGAIRGGMRYANYYGYDYVIQYDGDGQHQAEYIEDMLKAMEKYCVDIVIGSRFVSERKPLNIRMIGSQLITYAIFITTGGTYIGDVTSEMRLFNKRMIKKFGYHINYSPEPDTLAYLINSGIKIKEVQVHMIDRMAGTSYFSLGHSINYMLHMFFSIFIFQWFRDKLEEK